MVPNGAWAVAALLAMVPGWIYLRLRERHAAPNGSSGLSQLLDIVGVGLATAGTAAGVAIFIPHEWAPFLVDWELWARQGDTYQREHFRSLATSSLLIFTLATIVAVILDFFLRRGWPAEFQASGVWINALGKRPSGHVPIVGVELEDGRIYEGVLHSYTLEQQDNRDIALQAPIRLTQKAGDPPVDVALARIILPSRAVRAIGIAHVPSPKKTDK